MNLRLSTLNPQPSTLNLRAGGRLRGVTSNGVLALCDQAIVSGASFVASIIVGRYGSVAHLGVYYLVLRLMNLARELQSRAISAPYAVYCHRRPAEGRAGYAGSVLAHQLGAAAAMSIVLFGAALLVSARPELAEYRLVIVVAAISVPAAMLHDFVRQFTFAHQQMKLSVIIDVGVALLQIGGLCLVVSLSTLTAATALAVIGAAYALGCTWWFVSRRPVLLFHWQQVASDWWCNWTFAKWALTSKLIGELTPYLIPCVLTWVHGVQLTGAFAACATTVGVANVFVGGLGRFLCASAPNVYVREGLAALRQLLLRTSLLFVTTLGLLVLLMFWQGDLVLTTLYGNSFGRQSVVLGVLALGVLANSVGVVAGNGIWALERPRANLSADVITTLVSLLLAAWLIPPLGIAGAAIASTAGLTAGTLVRVRVLSRLMSELGAGRGGRRDD